MRLQEMKNFYVEPVELIKEAQKQKFEFLRKTRDSSDQITQER